MNLAAFGQLHILLHIVLVYHRLKRHHLMPSWERGMSVARDLVIVGLLQGKDDGKV